jgi:hypothetical protein
MARRHWLDPLARRLLRASGQLPGTSGSLQPSTEAAAIQMAATESAAIERELMALKLAHAPGRPLRSAEEVKHAAALGWRLDVNRATAADWLRLPHCRPDQVDLLLRLQSGGVQLSGPDDLQRLLDLSDSQLRSWLPLLDFRWYGTPPGGEGNTAIAVNKAEPRLLQTLPGLTAEGLQRLLQERRRRPFRDLAELQQRLTLPPSLVEAWIGRVRFDPAPAGPVLPPRRRPAA